MRLEDVRAREVSDDHLRERVHSRMNIWICCAGFEDRALAASRIVASPKKREFEVLIVRLMGSTSRNDEAFSEAMGLLGVSDGRYVFEYEVFNCERANTEFEAYFTQRDIPRDSEVFVDLSGFPSHGICQILRIIRSRYPINKVVCVYTAAEQYFPTEREFSFAKRKPGGFDADNLPKSLTYEASGTLFLSSFSGIAVRQDRACLVLFAGFERHRSIAAVEGINPRRMVIVYSQPSRDDLAWRCELSKLLHEDFHAHIERAETTVAQLEVGQAVGTIEEFYSNLYDRMNIVLCPTNSKLHTLACFLFWEMYRDVQICFTVPVKYLPERSSKGVGKTFLVELPESPGVNMLFGFDSDANG